LSYTREAKLQSGAGGWQIFAGPSIGIARGADRWCMIFPFARDGRLG